MGAALLGLLPGVLGVAPALLGGGGLITALLGFIPTLRTYVIPALLVILALAIAVIFYFKSEADGARAAIVQERADAQAAADVAIKKAADSSNQKIVELQNGLAAQGATADYYRELVANAKEPANAAACPPPAVDRDASRFLRAIANPSPAGNPVPK